jgi:UPF0755 protein
MKLWRYILIIGLLLFFFYFTNRINLLGDITIEEGDNYSKFFEAMSWRDRITLKIYLKSEADPALYPGVYRIEKPLSYKDFIAEISKVPQPVPVKIVLLEGWSSFDYEVALVNKWLIKAGEFLATVKDSEKIAVFQQEYEFLPKDLKTLEGFLYPDTYNVDANKPNIADQVVRMQLENFNTKVWLPNKEKFQNFQSKLSNDGYDFPLSVYAIIKLASIIENEEKNNDNKQSIASVFLNRLQQNMTLGADVTLCYGKSITYKECTPSFIVDHLYEKDNLYNTRQNSGLPPTPISNPSISSINWVLNYTKTPALYYLHDSKGKIYFGNTLEQHNQNKVNYIN